MELITTPLTSKRTSAHGLINCEWPQALPKREPRPIWGPGFHLPEGSIKVSQWDDWSEIITSCYHVLPKPWDALQNTWQKNIAASIMFHLQDNPCHFLGQTFHQPLQILPPCPPWHLVVILVFTSGRGGEDHLRRRIYRLDASKTGTSTCLSSSLCSSLSTCWLFIVFQIYFGKGYTIS